MGQLLAWIVLCTGFAVLTARKPTNLIAAVLAVKILVPSTAGQLLAGDWDGAWSFHPASWLVVIGFVVVSASRSGIVVQDANRRPLLYFGMVSVISLSAVVTLTGMGVDSMLRYGNVLIVPILFFALIGICLYDDRTQIQRLIKVIIAIVLFQAALALAQSVSGSTLLFERYHRLQAWWPASGELGRSLGTLDSPLDLALVLVCGIPLMTQIRNTAVMYCAAVLAFCGILVTESRQGVIFGAVALAYVVFNRSRNIAVSVFIIAGLGIIISNFLLSRFGGGLLERFTEDDGGSTRTRDVATQYFLDHFHEHVFTGGGFGYSFSLRGVTMSSSLENGYAISVFDFGVLVTSVYLALQVSILFARRRDANYARVAAGLGIVMCFGYSSFFTQGPAGILVWALLGVVSCYPPVNRPQPAFDVRRVGANGISP